MCVIAKKQTLRAEAFIFSLDKKNGSDFFSENENN